MIMKSGFTYFSMADIILRRGIILFFSITLGMWTVGCNSEKTPSTNTSNESATTLVADSEAGTVGKKKVLTTFSVLADIAQNVAGDKLNVESITRIGAEIHGYEPTPSDIVKAQDADLILYNGMNLERWFEQFLGNAKDVPSVLLTEGIEPIPISEGSLRRQTQPSCLDVPS